ncbi:HbrB-like-domain-containing protein [Phlyctochytrium arcticum]|nr:HbrB-like-domain-containing protein [Phlyctochytrium arcticum]
MATLDPQKMSREAIDPGAYRGGAWQALCQKVLPLFNGQGLKGHMEDLNDLVSNWLSDTPANVVVDDLNDLFTTGMMVLGNKIVAVADEALAGRLVEVWSFYFGTVVPYIQGVFLPVRTSWRTSGNRTGEPPNVREMSLVSFRDHIIAPLGGRLTEIFPRLVADIENGRKMNDTATRLMQMLYVLDGMRALIQDGDDPIAAVLRQRKRGGLHEVVI